MYPAVPPEIDKATEASFPPLQLTLVISSETEIALGSIIVIVSVK